MRSMISIEGLDQGLLYIFIPHVPGVFVCLNDHMTAGDNSNQEEEEKVSTISKTQTNKTTKLV